MKRSDDSMGNNIRLIINADDYGISLPVNSAIDYCLKNEIINSASVMVNTAFLQDACNRIKGSGYEDKLGIHINFTEFTPVTDFTYTEFLDEQGRWNKNAVSRFRLTANKALKKAVKKEIEAQVDIFLGTGLLPAHINSHHHCHTFPWMLPMFTELSEKMRVPLRISLTSPTGNWLKGVYRSFINLYISSKGIAFSDYFEDKYTYGKKKNRIQAGTVEIMVHPIFNSRNELVDTLDMKPLQDHLPSLGQNSKARKNN